MRFPRDITHKARTMTRQLMKEGITDPEHIAKELFKIGIVTPNNKQISRYTIERYMKYGRTKQTIRPTNDNGNDDVAQAEIKALIELILGTTSMKRKMKLSLLGNLLK